MASSSDNTNPPNPPQFEIGNVLEHSSDANPTVLPSHPPGAYPFLYGQFHQPPSFASQPPPMNLTTQLEDLSAPSSSSSMTNFHHERSLSYRDVDFGDLNIDARSTLNDEDTEDPEDDDVLTMPTPNIHAGDESDLSMDMSSKLPDMSATNSQGPYSEQSQRLSHPMTDSLPQILALQELMNQMMVSQKEMEKKLPSAVNGPIMKEGKRIESALGRKIESSCKSSGDSLWSRFKEENEKTLLYHGQKIMNAMNNFMNKELSAMFERTVKKELAAIGQAVATALTPAIEKIVSSAITESFKGGVADKAVNQLDKSVSSMVETTIARHIQAQFLTTGRQALQESLKSTLESAVIPSFERSCKTMLEQVDSTFQKGLFEHTSAVQKRLESGHSQLANTLKETISSVSSVAQALSHELAECQKIRLALPTPESNLLKKVEAPIDPKTELSRLISEHKYEEAFTSALHKGDVTIVSWLCTQVDLLGLREMNPLPLSQGVLLSLLQQLTCDISNDTTRKLAWMTDVAAAIEPDDQMIVLYGRSIFEQVYETLKNQQPNAAGSDVSAIRLIMHVINSMLMSYK